MSGPALRLSATPYGDVLATCISVYGATITADEFPSLRIVIRTPSNNPTTSPTTRIVLSADSKADHVALAAHLMCATQRSISHDYTFDCYLRDSLFSRVCSAEDHSGHPVCVKIVSKQPHPQPHQKLHQHGQLARREPVILLCLPGHPTLPSVRDVYESARAYYVVTEGLPINTLRHAGRMRGSFCERDVAVVVSDLLTALVQLRNTGLVHRFISPDSIVVDEDESRVRGVTIVDFEMATRPGSTNSGRGSIDALPPCPSLLGLLRGDEVARSQHAAFTPPELYTEGINSGMSGSNMSRREAIMEDGMPIGEMIMDDNTLNTKGDSSWFGQQPQQREIDIQLDADIGVEGDDEAETDMAFAHDVWSVGMVMHWMLVGCTPFDDHVDSFEAVSTLVADAHGMPVFSGPMWRGVTSGAKHLCASLLHADARARLPAPQALQHPWLRL